MKAYIYVLNLLKYLKLKSYFSDQAAVYPSHPSICPPHHLFHTSVSRHFCLSSLIPSSPVAHGPALVGWIMQTLSQITKYDIRTEHERTQNIPHTHSTTALLFLRSRVHILLWSSSCGDSFSMHIFYTQNLFRVKPLYPGILKQRSLSQPVP